MLRDLRFYYGIDVVDVIEGRGPCPVFVLELLRGLPDDSLLMALMRGGHEHLGWGGDRHLLADIYDALNANTRATGQWKKKPPDIEPHPRPKVKETKATKKTKKRVTLADLYSRFQPSGR